MAAQTCPGRKALLGVRAIKREPPDLYLHNGKSILRARSHPTKLPHEREGLRGFSAPGKPQHIKQLIVLAAELGCVHVVSALKV